WQSAHNRSYKGLPIEYATLVLIANGYLGGCTSLRKLSRSSIRFTNQARRFVDQISWSMGLVLSGAAPRPSAESINTLRTAGVSQLQFKKRFVPFRVFRFQLDGKSAWPTELSTGIDVMKYFVKFIGSSRPGPHSGQ